VADSPGDYYELLGVPRDADAKTIKDAFRQLARRYHPDTSREPDAVQRFKEIAEAYGVLSDPARRADYDAGAFTRWVGAAPEDVWAGIDFGAIFGSGGVGIGVGPFERSFDTAPQQGGDLTLPVTIPLQRVLAEERRTSRSPGRSRAGGAREAAQIPALRLAAARPVAGQGNSSRTATTAT
jgi:molecular chaperone DnaJ